MTTLSAKSPEMEEHVFSQFETKRSSEVLEYVVPVKDDINSSDGGFETNTLLLQPSHALRMGMNPETIPGSYSIRLRRHNQFQQEL